MLLGCLTYEFYSPLWHYDSKRNIDHSDNYFNVVVQLQVPLIDIYLSKTKHEVT
jgi:hypothetical protein